LATSSANCLTSTTVTVWFVTPSEPDSIVFGVWRIRASQPNSKPS
jgi:hypothetical protein